jgi:hypothetical protein
MMLHPELRKALAEARFETLRRSAADWRRRDSVQLPRPASADVELRLCRVADDAELERLAELEGRPLPYGRVVVAVVDGRIVAALPLGDGRPLADPFVQTAQLLPLLELRAAQIREPARRRLLLGFARLARS